jgi:hypothetical protein
MTVGSRYEGWDDRETEEGMVRRFDKRVYQWVIVEKSRFPERRRMVEGLE